MDLTFQEKSIWTSLITTVLLFGAYFYLAFEILLSENIPEVPRGIAVGTLFIGVIIVFVIIEAVVHIVLALASPPEVSDERDKMVGLKATRNGAILLAMGVWTSFGGLAFTSIDSMIMAHILLSSFILAEIVRFGSQLFYYRAGV